MPNEFAPEGQIFVCMACGKVSKDRFGTTEGNGGVSVAWDVSCMLHARLIDEDKLVFGDYRRVVEIKE